MPLQTPPRILVVAARNDIRDGVADLLAEEGYVVEAAKTTEVTADKLNQRDYNLVLADVPAAEADFWSVAATLKQAASPVEVGLLTAWPVDAKEALARGFPFLIHMPFDLEALLARVGESVRLEPPSEPHQTAIHSYFEALNDKAWSKLGALCIEDVRYHFPAADASNVSEFRGRTEFEKFSAATFDRFPDARFAVGEIIALPAAVVARYLGSWGSNQLPGSILFRFRAGLIAEIGIRLESRALAALT